MEVIYYQLAIAATIVGTHFFRPRFLLPVCWFWTVFTLVNLFFPPLIAIQLGVVWGTFYMLRKTATQERTIEDLPDERSQELFNRIGATQKEYLSGEKHGSFLDQSLKTARRRLCIVSGRINSYGLNKERLILIEECLKKGVNIYIGYGWENSFGWYQHQYSTSRIIKKLEKLSSRYPEQLFIRKYPIDEKLLIVDDGYVVIGSNNWLSNYRFRNRERSVVIRNPDHAARKGDRVKMEVLWNGGNDETPFRRL
jgi:phosphatidylserine/phosphatidylglycerophosphate/cardiolipin synthase-like enzyme